MSVWGKLGPPLGMLGPKLHTLVDTLKRAQRDPDALNVGSTACLQAGPQALRKCVQGLRTSPNESFYTHMAARESPWSLDTDVLVHGTGQTQIKGGGQFCTTEQHGDGHVP